MSGLESIVSTEEVRGTFNNACCSAGLFWCAADISSQLDQISSVSQCPGKPFETEGHSLRYAPYQLWLQAQWTLLSEWHCKVLQALTEQPGIASAVNNAVSFQQQRHTRLHSHGTCFLMFSTPAAYALYP